MGGAYATLDPSLDRSFEMWFNTPRSRLKALDGGFINCKTLARHRRPRDFSRVAAIVWMAWIEAGFGQICRVLVKIGT